MHILRTPEISKNGQISGIWKLQFCTKIIPGYNAGTNMAKQGFFSHSSEFYPFGMTKAIQTRLLHFSVEHKISEGSVLCI
jgi:hypothetical protein